MSEEKEESFLDDVEKQLNDDLPVIKNANSLYDALVGMTTIEKVGEEDFVMKSMIRGSTKNSILKKLREKHPDEKFTPTDLDKFLSKNPEVYRAMGKKVERVASRYLKAKEDVNEEMASLLVYTRNLIPKLQEEEDYTNQIAAIRALQNIIMNYAQLEGHLKKDDNPVNVNIVQQLSENKSNLKGKIKDADYDIEDLNNG